MAKKTQRIETYCGDCRKGKCPLHSEPPPIKKRVSWDDYFMGLAEAVATRSTCLRHNLGSVLVKDRRILGTGYNGAPRGIRHCVEVGCMRDKLKIPSGTRHEICMAVHAEQNAIIQAAVHGASTEGSEIFITHAPCAVCAKILINAGIKRIIFKNNYPDEFARKLLKEAKVEVVYLNGDKKSA